MTTDVFDPEGTNDDQVDNALEALVGEGKKFQTVEDLAKGKLNSDNFIKQLETEKRALEKDLEEMQSKIGEQTTLKEILAKLESKPNSDDSNSNHSETTTAEEIRKLIAEGINTAKADDSRKANWQKANNAVLQHVDGDVALAKQYIKKQADTLGMSVEALKSVAENSPVAFAKMVGLTASSSSMSHTPASITDTNSDGLGPSDNAERNVEYYKKMRAEDKRKFWSVQTQQELMKLGDKHGLEYVQKILNTT